MLIKFEHAKGSYLNQSIEFTSCTFAVVMPLGEELYYLCKNECPYMHICSDLESDAKVGISKPGQGI